VKINTNGVASGCLSYLACACIFRSNMGDFIGSFSTFHGVHKSLYVEVMRVILAIDVSLSKGFKLIWIEFYSSLLCQDFVSHNIIHWSLRER